MHLPPARFIPAAIADFAASLPRAALRAGGLALLLAVAACSTSRHAGRVSEPAPHYKVGKPYKVKGKLYVPREDPGYEEIGEASWYGADFHGRMTANGEVFDMNRMSAAHTTLPMPSMVEVTNLANGRKTMVRVNDRGPFASKRIIDLSREAARKLDFEHQGVARVKVKYVGPAPLLAKAPKAGEKTRVARAAPVKNAADDLNSAEVSAILTAMESAPALTQGAEEFAVAEAQSDAPGPAHMPATEITPAGAVEPRIVDVDISEAEAQALYVVRVAALSSLDNIGPLTEKLEPIGPLSLSRIETEDGSVFYRVNVGPFASIETAAARLDAVRAAGYDGAAMVTLTP